MNREINFKLVIRMLGNLLLSEGAALLLVFFISLIYREMMAFILFSHHCFVLQLVLPDFFLEEMLPCLLANAKVRWL
jgi:hypothetical protein